MEEVTQTRRGSALITVIMLAAIMAILASSMLRYSGAERRGDERNRLALRARNVAENVSIYAGEQLRTKLYRLGSAPVMHFDWTGNGTNRIYPPPDGVLDSEYSSANDVEVRAGIESASAYVLDTDVTSPNYDLQVSTARVPIIAEAAATHPALGTIHSYVEQDMEIALTPLFQFGMFYNMDLELYPSAAFTMAGPVHTNKRLMAMHDGSSNINIKFLKRVTSAQGLYADATIKAPTRGGTGSLTTVNYSVGDVTFTSTSGTQTSLKNSSNQWRDHKYCTSTETATTIANFKTFATNTYNGNLRTSAHGVTPLELPGIGTYEETDDPTTAVDERSNGRQIIEPPNADKWVWNSVLGSGSWTSSTDDPDTKETKISYKSGLYIMVNPDANLTPRHGTLPDGTVAYVLPHSYRAWLNAKDSSGTPTCTEVVLPGQPTYGYDAGPDGYLGTDDDIMYRNYLPNRFTELSVGGPGTGNQVLRIPQGGYGLATGYQLAAAQSINDTALSVGSGTGRILAGEVITIGSYKYVVAANFDGGSGTLTIASPGLRAAAATGDTVAVNPYGAFNLPSPAYNIYGAHSANATTINLRLASSGTGDPIVPGSTLVIGSYQYLVTAAPVAGAPTNTTTTYTVYLAPPGLRAAASSGSATSIDTGSFDLGTGLGYRLNGAHSTGATALAVDTGAGSILAGDTLFIAGNTYLVTSALNSGAVDIMPALAADAPDNEPVTVDPYRMSGYSRSTAYPAANTGSNFPTNSTAPYSAADAYFFDMRRANSNRGVTGLSGTTALYDRYDVPYVPRAIAKIDFDLTRLRMMVTRVMGSDVLGATDNTTASIYDVRAPNVTGVTWANSIFNASASRTTAGLGILTGTTYTPASYSVLPDGTDADTRIRPDPYQLYYAPDSPLSTAVLDDLAADPSVYAVPASALYDDEVPDAWYDGVAVYLYSMDAEKRAQTSGVPDRIDSGVRLWNGRGPVVSLAATNRTGFSFVTNDAVYTVGHFNADGHIDSAETDTGDADHYGGYSATYPDDSEEKLCAIMGDAYTPLSQPVWSSSTSGQVNGWNDALSAFPVATTSSSWQTGTSATSGLNGSFDGLYAASTVIKPGLLPNNSYPGSLGSNHNTKMGALDTEVSAATLMGVVPSNHDPRQLTDGYVPSTYLSWGTPAVEGNGVNSGGANNFPRLAESWSGHGLYIRGSIVALFESRVAMEPFTNGRSYQAPGRYWGLHYYFSQASHDVPLEPIVIGSTRVGFRELSAAEYEAKKTEIEGL